MLIGVRVNFFPRGGGQPSLPDKYFNSARRYNLQNCFARLAPPNVNENPGFRALHHAGGSWTE